MTRRLDQDVGRRLRDQGVFGAGIETTCFMDDEFLEHRKLGACGLDGAVFRAYGRHLAVILQQRMFGAYGRTSA